MLRERGLSRRRAPAPQAQGGATMIEVLVSIVITVFALLALAGLQTRMNAAVLESFQRSQALSLLQDITDRIQANQNQGPTYVADAVGTGDAQPADCSAVAGGRAMVDLCEWSNALKGAAETTSDGTANVGAMIGARGCVEQLQAANTASGICQPATYRITIAWQGINATVAPAVLCGKDLYGVDDSLRRAISSRVVVPLPACS
jgi:type IV pilus assembly protein PilV